MKFFLKKKKNLYLKKYFFCKGEIEIVYKRDSGVFSD
jgi:hypothetical protein